jgi:hypothetical protein
MQLPGLLRTRQIGTELQASALGEAPAAVERLAQLALRLSL